MRKTSNYQLNQWDEGDRILREDFNSDNAKIDGSIKAAENAHIVCLRHIDIPAGTTLNDIEFDLTDIHPEDWSALVLEMNNWSSDHLDVLVNGTAFDCHRTANTSEGLQFGKTKSTSMLHNNAPLWCSFPFATHSGESSPLSP